MRGMFKPLSYLFLLCAAIYLLLGHSSVVGVLEIAAVVFVGGAGFLTLFAYVCARLSMPRKATDFIQKK
jgi:hypothetical protein